jgi:small subunit ribosomal protein S5
MAKIVRTTPQLPEVKLEKKEQKLPAAKIGLEKKEKEFEEKVVQIDRVTYVMAGGKRMRFRALVVIGDRNGKIGVGVAKAAEIPKAVEKAVNQAKKRLIEVPIKNGTIPYEIKYKYGPAHILLKPASEGTGIIAGGPIRAVVELAGITDILSKMLGSENKINNVFATYFALKELSHEIKRA